MNKYLAVLPLILGLLGAGSSRGADAPPAPPALPALPLATQQAIDRIVVNDEKACGPRHSASYREKTRWVKS